MNNNSVMEFLVFASKLCWRMTEKESMMHIPV